MWSPLRYSMAKTHGFASPCCRVGHIDGIHWHRLPPHAAGGEAPWVERRGCLSRRFHRTLHRGALIPRRTDPKIPDLPRLGGTPVECRGLYIHLCAQAITYLPC